MNLQSARFKKKHFFLLHMLLSGIGIGSSLQGYAAGFLQEIPNVYNLDGISAYGNVLVGAKPNSNDNDYAFRWSFLNGAENLGTLPGGFNSRAYAANADGSVVVGYSDSNNGPRAFRWTQATGMQDLGTLPGGIESEANAVNADGSVVVGGSVVVSGSNNGFRAFRWTQATGMQDLGILPGKIYSYAHAVNADGSVVVGGNYVNDISSAFRWTQATGIQNLGTLPGGFKADAYAVNADGSVVVGYSDSGSSDGLSAFRWTQATGMQNLGILPGGNNSIARAVNADGNVVVGYADSNNKGLAFRWTQATGMQTVEDWLNSNGVQVAQNLATEDATGVSADGNIIVGQLQNGNAFIATLRGLIDFANFSASLASTNNSITNLLTTGDTVFNGAHSRPLSHRVAAGQQTFWLAGDWGQDDHGINNGELGLAEVAWGKNWGKLQINFSLGKNWANQYPGSGSLIKNDGTYIVAEALMPLSQFANQSSLWGSISAYRNWGSSEIHRGYLNAGNIDFSNAKPDTNTWGVRVRADWENALRLNKTSFHPYVDFNHLETELDAYSETDGGFPAQFNQRKAESTVLRLGVNANYAITDRVQFVGLFEVAHRFENRAPNTSGQLIGLFGFNQAGATYKKDWARLGVGLEGRLGVGITSVMFNTSTESATPNTWLNASYRVAF